jgi:signal transduction histidine kinase
MFKSSITKFLIASLGVLMIGLLVAALILAAQAWSRYELAGRIARLTRTDHTLFNALLTVRAQVPKVSTSLISQDDPSAVIDTARHNASGTVTSALGALQATDIANHSKLAAAIHSAWQKVEALQSTVDDQVSRPRSARNLHDIDGWREAIHGTIDALNTASAAVGNTVRIGDPLIAEMVQVRRTAWTIRDRYGLQCSQLRSNVETSAPLNAALLDVWSGNRAVYTAAWHTLDEFLLRPGVSTAMQQRIDVARNQTQLGQAKVDAIVAKFDNSGRPAVGSAEWTALCDGPFDAILAIAQQAQDEANTHAEAMRAAASRMLLVSGLGLIAVIAFGVFALINVQRRLARPMKLLIGTIARFSRREFDEAVPSTGSPDELGSMAKALETLRASALEAERLQMTMSRFTADASHQMRTPLSVLRAHISVLSNIIPPNNEAYSSLRDIQEASDRLQRLLIQLLKLARADSGQSVDSESGEIDLREVIQDIASKHVPQALEASVDLHFEAEQKRFPAMANPIMISEIFANLIDNAIRYNDAGGSVVVRLFDHDGKPVVDVEDDGPGIPDAEHDKVFTRFYRMNRDQSRVGSGLGLAIVRSFATSLNADIEMSKASGPRGLRVRIAFA